MLSSEKLHIVNYSGLLSVSIGYYRRYMRFTGGETSKQVSCEV